MNIKKVEGLMPFGLDKIDGSKFYYQINETHDFDDVINLKKYGLETPGTEILFFDSETFEVYKPFLQIEGIYYKRPIYDDGNIYFIKADINENTISIIKYDLKNTEEIFKMPMDGLNLGYIDLIKSPITFLDYQDQVEIYYPERLTIKKDPSENIIFRNGDEFYLYKWYEEGLEAGGVMGDDYRYYETNIIKDKNSNIISEEEGGILELDDGTIIIY